MRRLTERPSGPRSEAAGGHRVVSPPRAPGPLIVVETGSLTRAQLRHALTRRGFAVECHPDRAAVREAISKSAFAFAVVEPWMGDGDGLGLVRELRRESPSMRIVIVTARDSFAAAILALRAGADDYLPEPVDMSALVDALLDRDRPAPSVPDTPLAAARIRWEHVHRVFAQCGHDVRETARILRLQRRSLRTILARRAPPPRAAAS